MASYSGTSRDANRALSGQRIQDDMRAAFRNKVAEMKSKQEESIRNMELNAKFAPQNRSHQDEFNESIIGLQKKEEYVAKKLKLQAKQDGTFIPQKKVKKKKKNKNKKRKLTFNAGFSDEEVEEEQQRPKKKRKVVKNPSINTTFLPDPERDAQDDALREKLRSEFYEKQEALKKMKLTFTFSYYDGSNHRKTMSTTQGTTMGDFLEKARTVLEVNYPDLRGTNGDSLIFVKGDLIISHNFTFHDLIQVRACSLTKRELFQLEVWEDLQTKKTRAKDTSGHAKIVTRTYYERNKHSFPCSKWQNYDPAEHTLREVD